MKVSDIKGDLGRRIVKWVEDYINNRIFDEVKLFARPLTFCEQISLHNMADFKKFLSGIKVGFPTHACGITDKPYRSWNMHPIRSGYINKNTNEINVKVIDITDPLFTASIDIIPVSMGSPTKIYWCDLHYCIQCNRDAMMEKLSNMFDEDLGLELKKPFIRIYVVKNSILMILFVIQIHMIIPLELG